MLGRALRAESVSFLVTAAVTVGTTIAAFSLVPNERPLSTTSSAQMDELEKRHSKQLDSLRVQLVAVRRQVLADLDSLVRVRGDTAAQSARISLMRAQQAVLDQRLKRMEDVVLADPAKALDLVLLRRELQVDRDGNSARLAAVRQDVDRVYDLSKWIIGLMFTMSLGVLSLAAASIFKDRARQGERQ